MRIACLGVVAILAACAHGNSGDVDAGADAWGGPTVDALSCNNLPCDAIYVSRAGSDAAAGTKAAPVKTINVAIMKALAFNPPYAVFVQAGLYPEQVTMKPGVGVYGGFDETWMRTAGVITEINAPSPAIVFDQIATGTVLDTFTVRSGNGAGPGVSSYAIVITSSKMIELRDLTVEPGIGAAGGDGVDGGAGPAGDNGGNGNPGVEHSSGLFCDNHTLPAVGAAGGSVCGLPGGYGGGAGVGNGNGAQGGDAAFTSQSGGFGGVGGGHNPACGGAGDGQVGGDGLPGGSGGHGGGGAEVGVFEGPVYRPANGGDGGYGYAGYGGGGGGGGGGGTNNCQSSGSSGGGGGGGGCGGGFGSAGGGGGGSFGIVAVDSMVTLRSSVVTANQGGAGGRGGRGGPGGGGGFPGAGGAYGGSSEQDDGGCGARGGYGGAGGAGGEGGGGGGGASAALVCVGSATIAIPMSTVTGGSGGIGGPSLVNPGATGVSTRAIGCSFF